MRWSRSWIGLCALLAACGDGCGDERPSPPPKAPADAAVVPLVLMPGATLELSFDEDDHRKVELAVPAGSTFVEVAVEERGVDVRLVLESGDESLLEVSASPRAVGREVMPWIAATDRPLRVAVHALHRPAASGTIAVTLRTSDSPSDEERARARATLLEHDARLATVRAGDALPSAHRDWLAAAALWQGLGDRRRHARALERAGRALDMVGDNAGALDARLEAQAIQQEIGDRAGLAITSIGLGTSYTSLGRIDDAIAAYQRGTALCDELGIPVAGAIGNHNLAGLRIEFGELEPGLELLERSQRTFERLGRLHSVAIGLFEVGRVSELLGDPGAAREHYQRARDILRERNLVWDEGSATYLLGTLHASKLGDLQGGAALLDEALSLQRRAGNRRGIVNTLIARSWVRLLQGQAAGARDGFAEALAEIAEMKEWLIEAEALLGLGEALRELGDPAASLEKLDAALVGARRLGARPLEARVESARARSLAALGRRDRALVAARQAIDTAESLRAEIAMQSHRAGFSASVREHYDVLIDILLAKPDDAALREAFTVSERARARSLIESLRQARLEGSVDPEVAAELRRDARDVRTAERRFASLVAAGAPATERAAAERDITAAVRGYQRRHASLRRKSPAFADLVDPSPASLAAIQRALPADAVLLEYSLGDGAGFVWAVTRDEVVLERIAPRAAIEDQARRAIEALTARNRDRGADDEAAIDAALAELSASLLAPVAGALSARRVFVVPDGAAHYIPFGALPIPGEALPLIERAEVVVLPRASMLVDPPRARDRHRPGAPVAVLADPVFAADDPRLAAPRTGVDPGYPRLRFSRTEATSIAALVDGAIVALDTDASQERAQSAEVAAARVVHVATHGLLDTDEPALSALVLSLVDEDGEARDGLLRLHEVYRLELAAELVVLSGCETALGKTIRGEGVVGLTRGFLYAGADRVLASLWQIHDRATAELMVRFYRALLVDGLPAPAALRAAQRSLRAEARWSSPYYWAPFVLHAQAP